MTCPFALYTATSSGGDDPFNLINPKTHNRVRMVTTDPDTGPIERPELVNSYEFSKGSVRLESSKTIGIERSGPR